MKNTKELHGAKCKNCGYQWWPWDRCCDNFRVDPKDLELKMVQEFVLAKCMEKFKVDKSNHLLPIWKLNLAVVLNAVALETNINPFESSLTSLPIKNIFLNWELMTDDGLEVLFEGQLPQIQIRIAELLGFKSQIALRETASTK